MLAVLAQLHVDAEASTGDVDAPLVGRTVALRALDEESLDALIAAERELGPPPCCCAAGAINSFGPVDRSLAAR